MVGARFCGGEHPFLLLELLMVADENMTSAEGWNLQLQAKVRSLENKIQAASNKTQEWRDHAFGSQHMTQANSDILEGCAQEMDEIFDNEPTEDLVGMRNRVDFLEKQFARYILDAKKLAEEEGGRYKYVEDFLRNEKIDPRVVALANQGEAFTVGECSICGEVAPLDDEKGYRCVWLCTGEQ